MPAMSRSSLVLVSTSFATVLCFSATRDTGLADAAKQQNKNAIRSLLSRKVDVNAPQDDGATAILWAAHWGDLEMADLLIRAGADVNRANELGVAPLILACNNGSAAMTAKL